MCDLSIKIPAPDVLLESYKNLQTILPNNCGVYFWYFRNIEVLFTKDMIELLCLNKVIFNNGYYLLYIGMAEGQSIRERIIDKHLSSAHVSTLRYSIGSLLAYKHNIIPYQYARRGKFAVDETWDVEKRISTFIEKNAMLSWIESDRPKIIEKILLGDNQRISFPLNIQCNRRHPFRPILSAIRRKYKKS